MHADEVSFVFGEPLYSDMNFTEIEKKFSRKLLKYWSNFVRYDNPNGPKDQYSTNNNNNNNKYFQNQTLNQEKIVHNIPSHRVSGDMKRNTQTMRESIEYWPKYDVFFDDKDDRQRAYLILDANKIEVDHNFRSEYCSFWGSYLPNLILNESITTTKKNNSQN